MTGLPNYAGLAGAMLGASSRRVTGVRMANIFGGLGGLYAPDFEHIVELEGPGWRRTRAQVVADIDGGWRYYVDNDLGPRAELEVMPPKTLLGDRYVRTKPDCTPRNNLLSLPRF